MSFDLTGKKVLVLGHRGLVGASLVERLASESCMIFGCRSSDTDLRRQAQAERLFDRIRPDVVFLAAARVGGILANWERQGEFSYDNTMIAANVIEAARQASVQKLVFLGSSCIYPREAPQPISEASLLSGPLEETNRAYAVSKIAGVEMCRAYRFQYGCDFISVMPCNIYGERDHFDDVLGSHVMAALIRRIVQAKHDGIREITIWGTGAPRREFLHADDLADALVFLTKNYSSETLINVGPGDDLPIADLARLIADAVEWAGVIHTDPSKPDGTPRKVMDVSRLAALGWSPKVSLQDGIRRAARAYEGSLR